MWIFSLFYFWKAHHLIFISTSEQQTSNSWCVVLCELYAAGNSLSDKFLCSSVSFLRSKIIVRAIRLWPSRQPAEYVSPPFTSTSTQTHLPLLASSIWQFATTWNSKPLSSLVFHIQQTCSSQSEPRARSTQVTPPTQDSHPLCKPNFICFYFFVRIYLCMSLKISPEVSFGEEKRHACL